MARKKRPRNRRGAGDERGPSRTPPPAPSRFTVATSEEFKPPPVWTRIAGLAIAGITAAAAAFLIAGAFTIGGGFAVVNALFGIALAGMAVVMAVISVAPHWVRSFVERRQARG